MLAITRKILSYFPELIGKKALKFYSAEWPACRSNGKSMSDTHTSHILLCLMQSFGMT